MVELILFTSIVTMIGAAGFVLGRHGGWYGGYNAALVKHDIYED